MILTDSHCHLQLMDLAEFGGDLDAVMKAAKQNQVEHLLCVGTTLEDLPAILKITQRYSNVKASVGLHPNEPIEKEPTVEQVVTLALPEEVVAIGETGLDYYRSEGDLTWQRERFRVHIRAAIQANKPLIIHTRDAKQDTLRILQEEKAREIGGVFHCFTEDWETASQALDLGFYISISGIVTFKNAIDLQNVVRKLPLQSLLIETDAPYLAPMPHRGKMNQPSFVKHVAEFIAALKETSLENIAEQTTANYLRLFKL